MYSALHTAPDTTLEGAHSWKYARFLDFASARLLMKKVGRGYVFFQSMLLKHFAQRVEERIEKVEVAKDTDEQKLTH